MTTTKVTKKRLVTITPILPDLEQRRILITTTSDGKETPNVIHGEIGVTFRWDHERSITYPWTSIFTMYEQPVSLDYEIGREG